MESAAKDAETLTQENANLKKINEELTKVVREVKQEKDSMQRNLEQQQQELGYKLKLIEEGCGRELVLRLKSLRDEVLTASQNLQSTNSSTVSYAEDSVDNMAKQISQKVRQLARQREALQNAVNLLQQEKQELFNSL